MSTIAIPVLRNELDVAVVSYIPEFLLRSLADELDHALHEERVRFRSGFMLVGELWRKTPRLAAEFGDEEYQYADTGPNGQWPETVRIVRDTTASYLGCEFNYALANWYRNGSDFAGWHSDKMEHHTPGSSIAMVSTGATRRFQFRSTATGDVQASVDIEHGSLLVMEWPSQVGFEHSLRPDDTVTRERISLTFRHVLPTPSVDCTCGQAPR